jgi:hypothetical protein
MGHLPKGITTHIKDREMEENMALSKPMGSKWKRGQAEKGNNGPEKVCFKNREIYPEPDP